MRFPSYTAVHTEFIVALTVNTEGISFVVCSQQALTQLHKLCWLFDMLLEPILTGYSVRWADLQTRIQCSRKAALQKSSMFSEMACYSTPLLYSRATNLEYALNGIFYGHFNMSGCAWWTPGTEVTLLQHGFQISHHKKPKAMLISASSTILTKSLIFLSLFITPLQCWLSVSCEKREFLVDIWPLRHRPYAHFALNSLHSDSWVSLGCAIPANNISHRTYLLLFSNALTLVSKDVDCWIKAHQYFRPAWTLLTAGTGRDII